MNHDSQVHIPPSFIALFMEPGKHKPSASAADIAQRYELCEDMAQLLIDTTHAQMHRLGITASDVIATLRRGLHQGDTFTPQEADWIVLRLDELLRLGG
jgi:hypothetical protein